MVAQKSAYPKVRAVSANAPAEARRPKTKEPKTPKKICTEEGCGRVVLGRGLCGRHYAQVWRTAGFPPREKNPGQRLCIVTVTLRVSQLVKVNRLLAHRNTLRGRAALYREMADVFFASLSPDEQAAIEKPLPVSLK